MASKSVRCSVCGGAMWKSPDLAAVPCCLPCRRGLTRQRKQELGIVVPRPSRPVRRTRRVWFPTCAQCTRVFCARNPETRYCSTECVGKSQQVRPDDARRVIRSRLDRSRPGLSEAGRRELLSTWQRQGRTCFYCTEPADTVDHVVPLIRGGTNYEGNLVPACKSCNSSKSARTVAEWRYGRPPGRSSYRPGNLFPGRPNKHFRRSVSGRGSSPSVSRRRRSSATIPGQLSLAV